MSPIKIPVSIELLADMETPLSVYKKLANKPYSYLFESVEGGEKWARYSLIGLPSKTVIRVFKNKVSISNNGEVIKEIINGSEIGGFNIDLVGFHGQTVFHNAKEKISRQ